LESYRVDIGRSKVDHFKPSLFTFLRELKDNNTREWFQKNKTRYRTEVQKPLLEFIAAFSQPLSEISSHFVADPRPVGGSMFRIYRDVRFSRDKSPYKTHAAAQFRHRQGRDVHAPGFYLHLEPDNVFLGAGIWHPAGPTIKAIRTAIADDPNRWREVTAGLTLGGDSLNRGPRDFKPDHPMIEELKRKDFVTFSASTQSAACERGFLAAFARSCEKAGPMVRFLTEAVGIEF
jgi:uncharacterized protein (TIGR02453 family)